MKCTASTVLFLAVVLAGCTSSLRSDAVVARFEAALVLRDGGLLDVDETFAVRFGATAVSAFTREVPADRHDGVSGVQASLDGQPVAGRGDPNYVRIGRGPDVDVTWMFSPTSGAGRLFNLRYQAAGTVSVAGLRGTFSWRALPAGREFDVATARIVLTLPAGTTVVSDVRMEEPGWRVVKTADGATAERTGVASSESATMTADIVVEAGSIARPVWQENAERGRLVVPAFVSGGLFILVVGVGALWMVWLQSPGWLHAERTASRRGLRVAGLVMLALAGLTALVFSWTLGHFGRWPMAIPVSIGIVGLMLLAAPDVVSRRP